MWKSITRTFKNYFRFCGKADRREFWIWAFMILAVSFVLLSILAVLAAIFGNSNNPVTSGIFSTIIIVLIGLFWPVMFLPTLTVSVRRLRDAGVAPWLLLIPAILCIVTFLVLFDRGLSNMDATPPRYPDAVAYTLTALTAITGVIFLVLFCKKSIDRTR